MSGAMIIGRDIKSGDCGNGGSGGGGGGGGGGSRWHADRHAEMSCLISHMDGPGAGRICLPVTLKWRKGKECDLQFYMYSVVYISESGSP